MSEKYKYLNKINSPEDLRKLEKSAIPQVCNEVRDFMVDTITKSGGHFGAGLGVVELTVALHYVFNTPKDKIIFDVGHQGYPHKIITGRRDVLHTIRKKGGISGFLKPAESPYDAFGAGHASTSISAALGMATARDLKGEDYNVAAIIGDGSMTGGMAFEAMNNCGVQKRNMIVILNDNDFSIASNVSALSNYFNELYASTTMQKIRDNIWDIAGKMDSLGDRLRRIASRLEDGVKAIVTPGVLFEALGFNYFGPIDGHNVQKLIKMLTLIKEVRGPVFLHIITQKGKGYAPAENDAHKLHAIGKIDRETGTPIKSSGKKIPKYQDVFGHAMIKEMEKNKKIVGITAAMPDGTGLDMVQEKFSERVFDVGIAEGHAVTYAAGMAMQGLVPVVAIYSSFLQRAYDQIIHDVSLQKLHVVFAIDRAGLVGSDGPTHHGTLDLSYLRVIPGIVVMAPKDEQELRNMLHTAVNHYDKGPVVIRYPRGSGLGLDDKPASQIRIGQSETLKEGKDIAILAIGKMVTTSLKAAEILEENNISAEVINARFVKPIDMKMIDSIYSRFDKVITVEDNQKQGGFGSAVLEAFSVKNHTNIETKILGLPDNPVEHGSQDELHADLGLDAVGIANSAAQMLSMELKSETVNDYIKMK